MYYQIIQASQIIPKSYNSDTLEGNWYEDRCASNFDSTRRKDLKLRSPNAWQYETTYAGVGTHNKNTESLKTRFINANDNYINFQNKDYNMYITTNR
jgi:hypothetical protein